MTDQKSNPRARAHQTTEEELIVIAKELVAVRERLSALGQVVESMENDVKRLRELFEELMARTARLEERVSLVGLVAGALSLIISAIAAALNYFLLHNR